jgi:hypothetical protein
MRSGVRGKCVTSGLLSIERCCRRCSSWRGGTPGGGHLPRICGLRGLLRGLLLMLLMLLLRRGLLMLLVVLLRGLLLLLLVLLLRGLLLLLLMLLRGLLLMLLVLLMLLPSTSSRSA